MQNIEKKIYEILGVKVFRKMVIAALYVALLPFQLKKTHKERIRKMTSVSSNYFIGKKVNYETISDFRKQLWLNASIHIIALYNCLTPPYDGFKTVFYILLNTYCIMLQRYNYIRIKEILTKLKPRYDKECNKVIEEIKEKDERLSKHKYRIITMRNKENDVSLDELINKASLTDLKLYRKKITSILSDEKYNEFFNMQLEDHLFNVGTKTLKLEYEKRITD